jgi:hypothetical protein
MSWLPLPCRCLLAPLFPPARTGSTLVRAAPPTPTPWTWRTRDPCEDCGQ